jgi:phosphoribosylformylglycinamidine synthase
MATDAIVAIQDMGAAGLTSSSVEMAGKGGVGIELDLDAVPQRETGMSAYEMMLSESQERMLIVLNPAREAMARAIFEKWELDFAVIGHITDTGRIKVRHQGRIEADIPLQPLADEAPLYERPYTLPTRPEPLAVPHDPVGLEAALLRLLACPDLAAKNWIWDQYDATVGGQTIKRPGQADAAIVRIPGTHRALALTTDCTPRYCAADPEQGGAQAVIEAWRNITATGATPLAVTDNLNFGNPEKPHVMGQIVAAIRGMGAACRALDFPIVSGNVSLYNETEGQPILPTPAIGGLGVIEHAAKAVGIAPRHGDTLILIGATTGELGQSLWLREILHQEQGAPPSLNYHAERTHGDFVRTQITHGQVSACHVSACHDLSDGGLLIALAEMALAANIGLTLTHQPLTVPPHAFWFGEDQARYIIATPHPAPLLAAAAAASIPATQIGHVEPPHHLSSGHLTLPDGKAISITTLREANQRFFTEWFA